MTAIVQRLAEICRARVPRVGYVRQVAGQEVVEGKLPTSCATATAVNIFPVEARLKGRGGAAPRGRLTA
jgi:hypothetical protein